MKILVNGQLVEYKKQGSGRPVLLLHGWGPNLTTFDALSAHLVERGYEVFRLDFPGFGGSPAPKAVWSVEDYTALTAAFIEKLKLAPLAAVFGHSFGGRVIIKGLATGAFTAEQFVLMGAAGIKPPKTFKKSAYKAVAKVGKTATSLPGMGAVRTKLRAKLYSAAGSTDYLNAGVLKPIFLKTINEDLAHHLKDVAQPGLLIWGDKDDETLLVDGQRMQKEMQNAKLVVSEGSGHFVYLDDPKFTFEAIDGFLK